MSTPEVARREADPAGPMSPAGRPSSSVSSRCGRVSGHDHRGAGAFSLLGPRYGWTATGPANWNLLGLISVVAGIAGLIWVFGVMLAQIRHFPGGFELEDGERLWLATGGVLLTHGPFAYARPRCSCRADRLARLGDLLWESGETLIVALVLWASSHYLTVPREERALEVRFGDAYRDYRRRVPRWLGARQHG